MHLDLDHYLKHFGYPIGLSLMGSSIGAWLADHAMGILSPIVLIFSAVLQYLTYRLKKRETEAKLGASK
ncbi:hypothetical protein [Singulisphaera sp. PoT]|uniref:hypothetical protein n=1 Tax=Singulisphaera sp. PoT TaxID=3411797 RepID=UPI003BF48613